MSDAAAARLERLNIDDVLSRIERQISESAKLQEEALKLRAEQNKLGAEQNKRNAEAAKFRRDPWLVLVGAGAAILGAAVTKLPEILRMIWTTT